MDQHNWIQSRSRHDILYFCVMFCWLLFVILSFIWTLHFLSFFDLRLPLASFGIFFHFFYNIQFVFLEVSLAFGSLCSLDHMNTELQQRVAHIELLQRAMQDLRYQIDQKDDKIKKIKRKAEDLRTR